MDSSTKNKLGQRDIVVKFDDRQIKELLVHVDREQGAPIVYANLSKFSRLGVDFVLDLVQIDPAEFHLMIEAARQLADKPSQLDIPGKVVARILMGPILVKNVRDQADQILQGVAVTQPRIEDTASPERTLELVPSSPKQVQ
jgi:NAD(P)H-dependent flavin oxidoreductase YrpB (nitropropane dioxygenase family)